MGLHRYYSEHLPVSGRLRLPADESHHALRVRREAVGNHCVVFDGRGFQAMAVVAHTGKRECEVEIERVEFLPHDLPGDFQIAVALPKGDRLKAVIERAVELGVHSLVPILCERSVKIPNDGAIGKSNRMVIEACKQCERNRLMLVHPAVPFREWIVKVSGVFDEETDTSKAFHAIAHPDILESNGDSHSPIPISMQRFIQESIKQNYRRGFVAIGPEGGFSDSEVRDVLNHGWQQISMTNRYETNWVDVEGCQRWAMTFASIIESPQVILLDGTLGAGKTQLTQYVASCLGAEPGEVTSPTFVIVQSYQTQPRIVHLDLYRVHDDDELLELGIEEMFEEDTIMFIEWGAKFESFMPADHLSIHIEVTSQTERTISIESHGPRSEQLLRRLQESKPE